MYHATARGIACAALIACAVTGAAAQETAREPGSELTVFLATIGPGDQVWEKFGHNGIWIRDATTGSTIAYHYGIFDFSQERFIPRLMKGDMLYSMGVDDAQNELARYAYFNRTIQLQQLNLTPGQKHALREFLEWNWLPRNRHYRYDYFRDNCSTRVRDALDHALGGALRRGLQGVATGETYRSHSLRLTAAAPATYTGLLLGLGLPTDRPIDAWEESFIPMELMRHVREIRVADRNGRSIPLVAEELTPFDAGRSLPPANPPQRFILFLLLGLLLAGGLLLLSRFAPARRMARAGLALAIFFWGLTTGFFGLILAALWLFTDHTAAYPNLNLLQVSPLGLFLAAAAPLAVVGSRSSRIARVAWPTALAGAALSAVGVLLHAFPALRQGNAPLIALLLPVHLAVVLCLYRVRVSGRAAGRSASGRSAAPAAA